MVLFVVGEVGHAAAQPPPITPPAPIRHVILISMDGLRPDAVTSLSQAELPNFYRLRRESAFTDNARADVEYTITLPNHLTQLTGRQVAGPEGHNWTENRDPASSETIHSNKGAYVASVFDVAHENGLRTGAYVSKTKFVLLDQSYGGANGSGRDKLDAFVLEEETAELVSRFIRDMQAEPFGFAFLHLRDADASGHDNGWSVDPDSDYMEAVRKLDGLLGQILTAVEDDPVLAGTTTVILTADHGGRGEGHSDPILVEDYTIPFYVWGAGVTPTDLYALNSTTRRNPGMGRPGYGADLQPVRNGDAANLALSLLGLGPVPGSTINATASLTVSGTPRVLRASDVSRPVSSLNIERVYPNPAHQDVRVDLDGIEPGLYLASVFDPLGRLAHEVQFEVTSEGPHTALLDLRMLASGMYVLRVRHLGPGGAGTARLVIVN